MICEKCEKPAKKLNEVFSISEKNAIIMCSTDQLRHLETKVGSTQLKLVHSSVITKVLLSFEIAQRQALLQIMRQGLGYDLKLDNCQHSMGIVR